jgi:hypothetical protein
MTEEVRRLRGLAGCVDQPIPAGQRSIAARPSCLNRSVVAIAAGRVWSSCWRVCRAARPSRARGSLIPSSPRLRLPSTCAPRTRPTQPRPRRHALSTRLDAQRFPLRRSRAARRRTTPPRADHRIHWRRCCRRLPRSSPRRGSMQPVTPRLSRGSARSRGTGWPIGCPPLLLSIPAEHRAPPPGHSRPVLQPLRRAP